MARIRTIKPEFWTDSFMVQLPPIGRLVFISLWTVADDRGYVVDESARIAMEVMPREDPTVIDDWIQFFLAAGKLDLFCSPDGGTFYRVRSWDKHQKVDRPSKSRIEQEGSKKVAIPQSTRRAVAEKYGCLPGETAEVACFYCGVAGRVHWHRLFDGRPSSWITFPGLELDHLEPEHNGGEPTVENIILSCRACNRHKGTRSWLLVLCGRNGADPSRILASTREATRTLVHGKEEDRGKDQGKDQGKDEEEETPARTVLKLHADDPFLKSVEEIILAANRGMIDNPAIGDACQPIPTDHSSREVVTKWVADGIPPDVAALVVYQRARAWKPSRGRKQVVTMLYFDGAVREEGDKHRARSASLPSEAPSAPVVDNSQVGRWKREHPEQYERIEQEVRADLPRYAWWADVRDKEEHVQSTIRDTIMARFISPPRRVNE